MSYLLGVGSGSVLRRELDLAGGSLGEEEDALVGALGDGAVELGDAGAGQVDVVLVDSVLR